MLSRNIMNIRQCRIKLGCGLIARVHAAAILPLENLELWGVYDANEQAALAFAEKHPCRVYGSYSEMLADPELDAVSLCTPPSLHLTLAREAARAGKHLVVEKPLSADLREASEMVSFCREQGVLLCGILQHRFDPLVLALKELFRQDVFGRILMADARILWYRDDDYYHKVPWHAQKKNGGVMLNQAIHYMDLLGHLTGGIGAVTGVCRTLGHDIEPEDCAVAALEFRCSAVGTLEASTVCYPGICAELTIFTQKGYICIRDESLAGYRHCDGAIPQLDAFLTGGGQLSASARPDDLEVDSHRAELSNFADALLGKAPLAVTGEEALQVLAFIDAVTRSSEAQGQRIALQY